MAEGRIAFVPDGARSKSRHAPAHEAEMAGHIDRRRAERDAGRTTVEAPLPPAQTPATEAGPRPGSEGAL